MLCLCPECVRVSVTMVKVSFNAALAQKEVKKDAETLLADEAQVSRKWLFEELASGSATATETHFVPSR